MYLANDIIQNSKKKGPEYGKEFSKVLKKAFSHIGDTCASDNRTIGSLGRILKIWEDRGVYDEKAIVDFRTELQKDPKSVAQAPAPAAERVDKPEKSERERAPVNGSEKRSIDKVAEKSRSSDNNNRKKQKTRNSEAVAPKEDKQTTQFVLSPRSAAGMSWSYLIDLGSRWYNFSVFKCDLFLEPQQEFFSMAFTLFN